MDNNTLLRQIQKEKAIGELLALKASYYDPMGTERDKYDEVAVLINDMVDQIRNEV